MSKEKWIELPNVTEATGGEIIVGDIGLPYGLDAEALQMNVDAIRRNVIGWGGYACCHFSSYSGDRDEASTQVSGVNDDGTMTGISSKVKKADRAERFSHTSDILSGMGLRNGVLSVVVNSNKLNDEASLEQQFDPGFKAKQLDKTIKPELYRAVSGHLIGDRILRSGGRKPWVTIMHGFVDGAFLYGITANLAEADTVGLATDVASRGLVVGGLLPLGMSLVLNAPRNKIATDPLFFSASPTRAAIGVGGLAISRLVRPTPLSSKIAD